MDEVEACLLSLAIAEDSEGKTNKDFSRHDLIQMDHIYVKNETALEAEEIGREVAEVEAEASETAILLAIQEDFINEPVETRRRQPLLDFTECIRNPSVIPSETPPSLVVEPVEPMPVVRQMNVKEVELLFGATVDLYGLGSNDRALVITILQSLIHFGENMEIITVVVHRKRTATTLDLDVHVHYASFLNLTDSHMLERLLEEKKSVRVLIEQSRNHVERTFCLHIAADYSPSCKVRRHAKLVPILPKEIEKGTQLF